MLSTAVMVLAGFVGSGGGSAVTRTPVDLFSNIFTVFLILGTIVGVVVIAYTLQKAWRYRDGSGKGDGADVNRPSLGEVPSGSGGGKKLFVSFGISAIIVLSLIVWTYSALLYVEGAPDEAEDELVVEVTGEQFSWTFEYPNGATSIGELRVPKGQMVKLEVTSADVMHNIGIPEFRVKTDAIPGQTTSAWFQPDRIGTFQANCYELCGRGHSGMAADVIVMEQGNFQDWYANNAEADAQTNASSGGNASASSDGASHAIGGPA
ncbi:cytochrome c oxidase subunit II [Halobacteriales archaeon Cl-PHB]